MIMSAKVTMSAKDKADANQVITDVKAKTLAKATADARLKLKRNINS